MAMGLAGRASPAGGPVADPDDLADSLFAAAERAREMVAESNHDDAALRAAAVELAGEIRAIERATATGRRALDLRRGIAVLEARDVGARQIADVGETLDAIGAALSTLPLVESPDGKEIDRSLAARVLDDEQFANQEHEGAVWQTWQRLRDRLQPALGRVLDVLAAVALPIQIAAGLIVAAFLAIALHFGLAATRGRSRRGRRGAATTTVVGAVTEPASAAELRTATVAALAAGRHDEALRLAFLLTLRVLVERGLIAGATVHTNGEHRRRLAARGAPASVLAAFDAIVETFERIVYGGRPCTPEAAHRAFASAELLASAEVA